MQWMLLVQWVQWVRWMRWMRWMRWLMRWLNKYEQQILSLPMPLRLLELLEILLKLWTQCKLR
jgi:hypothetical protein